MIRLEVEIQEEGNFYKVISDGVKRQPSAFLLGESPPAEYVQEIMDKLDRAMDILEADNG